MRTNDELLELAALYADGAATRQQVDELQAALRADEQFRRTFIQYLNIDSALAGAIETARTRNVDPMRIGRPHSRVWPVAGSIAAAAAVLALCLWLWWPAAKSPIAKNEVATAPAAVPVVLTAATEARWTDPDVELSLRAGEMPSGLLRLESGVAEFRFAKGATAVLLGPVAVKFTGENQMFLQDGKVLCRCPTPESRITLTTPATQIVDLGTEFAVDAGDQAETRVAVVSGKVRVGTTGTQLLEKGQSAVVGPDKVVRLTPLPTDAFADLFRADPSRISPLIAVGNLLADPAFSHTGSGGAWVGTEGHAEALPGGQAALHARWHRLWPSFRQTVATGDISGRLVIAEVQGVSSPQDPVCERQSAILKISFLDVAGREFATASRHFLLANTQPGESVAGNVAAFAPVGTRKVVYQLMLSARGQANGTVIFRDPRLFVGPASGTPSTQP